MKDPNVKKCTLSSTPETPLHGHLYSGILTTVNRSWSNGFSMAAMDTQQQHHNRLPIAILLQSLLWQTKA